MRRPALFLHFLMPLSVQACPDLQPLYLLGDSPEQAAVLESRLAPMMGQCLESPEFFALYGAAQLDAGKLPEALETLERALLLDPSNGAAQIDYAQALYMRGQLFSALDLNDQILQRSDLRSDLKELLTERRQQWRRQTRRHGFQTDILAGHDNNLNGAPDPSQITLTLSGEPVILRLNEEYRPVSGSYLNLRAGGQFQQLASGHQHNVAAEVRGRVSEDEESDLLHLESRYAFERPRDERNWRFTGGLSHLLFGGSQLYTAAEGGAHLQIAMKSGCLQGFGWDTQYQLYHAQSNHNSLESKVSGGLECPLPVGERAVRIGAEISLLSNLALKDRRPGGDRAGWQVRLNGQVPLLMGVLNTQLHHTTLNDRTGYSPLLESGADRWLSRSSLLLQYRQSLNPDIALVVNFYRQHQRSNIELFDSIDTTLEVGVSLVF